MLTNEGAQEEEKEGKGQEEAEEEAGGMMGRQEELLKQVIREGGSAYAAHVLLAAGGDLLAAQAALDMAWEQLHSAPWHSVHPIWRDAFSLSSLHLAAFLDGAHNPQEALRILDMGLIMGGRLFKPDLDSAISVLHPSSSRMIGSGKHSQPCTTGVSRTHAHENASPTPEEPLQTSSHPSEIIANLPSGSLNFTVVKKRASITIEDFLCKFFIPGVPVVITHAMTHWPAMTKWRNTDYLREAVGNRTVPVEIGEHYLASGWKQELMTVFELLERFETQCSSSQRAYLAQHPLFEQIPKLREDILIPDYCAASGGELQSINAWLGPVGTVTPLHHDPHHNLLSQVIGQKYVRLYSPDVGSGMYPFSESMLSNSSQVDLDNPDYIKFPLAKNLPFLDCILEEGEMLYIPPKWWHYVRSLSSSFSVSFWWSIADHD